MTEQPFFSIVVPTFNRPQRLARCLRALSLLDYPPDQFEVIVVDDGSKPSLAALVESFHSTLTVRYVYQSNQGPAAARNYGARQANGRFFAFTDDDCAPDRSWLSHLGAQLAQEPQKMVGGYTINGLPSNPFSITSQLLIDFLYHYYNRTESRARFFTSNNFAVAATQFWEIGGFNETMPLAAGEDRELCDRWLERNLEMVYLPQAVVFHAHELGPLSFWRQHFNYGRGAWRYHALRSQRLQQKVALESPTFYLRLITFPLTMARDIRAYLLTGMLCLTQAANAGGFLFERLVWPREKKKLPERELRID